MIAVVPGLLLLPLAWYYKEHPPKNINWLYGYRTKRSMANQEVWEYANRLGAKMI
ncbi:SdpI family protein [Maribacter algicola]|uniref:SdpI family protein n=1 Tax=Meishania litoralis TaxID=3434685 RepID=A0ACC7LHA5_9FLAO